MIRSFFSLILLGILCCASIPVHTHARASAGSHAHAHRVARDAHARRVLASGRVKPPRGYISEVVERGKCSVESPRVRPGTVVTLAYTARIAPNSPRGERRLIFDSAPSTAPLRFIAGSDAVIRGWSHGVVGMCSGERRRLTIPAVWAYGEEGTRGVPPGASIEIDMTLLRVEKAPNLFAEMDADRDGRLTSKEIRRWLKSKGVPEDDIETVVNHLMEQDDANDDGVITINEYSGPRG